MSSIPSVKGILILGSVMAIRSAIKSCRITRDSVELMLEARDIEILDAKIEPHRWYPIDIHGRLQEVVAKIVGGDRIAAFKVIGANGAGMVRDTGTYGQMDFDEGDLVGAPKQARRFFARKAATMHEMMFNFGTCRVEVDDKTNETFIHYEEVSDFPESIRYGTLGFTAAVAKLATGVALDVSIEGVEEDRFTMRIGGSSKRH